MLIECTKLLTGAPQARRFAAMCTSGFGHRAQYPFNEALLATLRVSDEAGIGICTKDGLRHQCSLENHGTEISISHAGSGSGCECSVSYLFWYAQTTVHVSWPGRHYRDRVRVDPMARPEDVEMMMAHEW